MSKASRDKGMRRENEFVEILSKIDPEAKRVPLSGAQRGFKNDVIGLNLEWEVKARKSGFKMLYGWLEDEREQPDALALKVDRKEWLVCMTLEKFLDLMKNE